MVDKWDIPFFTKILPNIPCLQYGQKINGAVVSVDEAPEPFDIVWENLGIPWAKKTRIRIISSIVAVILIILSFVGITAIKYLQQTKPVEVDDEYQTPFNFSIVIVITIINILVGMAIWHLSVFNRYTTITNFSNSLCARLAMASFLNSTIILVFVNWLVYGDELNN